MPAPVGLPSLADFQATGLPSTATTGVPDSDITDAIANAYDMVLDSFSSQYTLPMVATGNSFKQAVINIAALMVLDTKGEDPEGNAYKTWDRKVNKVPGGTVEWLRQVREREVHPAGCTGSNSPTGIMPGPQATPLISPWNPSNFGC